MSIFRKITCLTNIKTLKIRRAFLAVVVTAIIFVSIDFWGAHAGQRRFPDVWQRQWTTGPVVAIDMENSTLTVYDSRIIRNRVFIVSKSRLIIFKVGDMARVYFREPGLYVTSVVKLTPLEYDAKTQNKGFIYRKQIEQ